MFQLIGHALETEDFKTILKEATRFLGGESRYQTLSSPTVRAPKMRDDMEAREKKLKHVAQIVAGTRSIQGTVAERYLREHRAILNDINIISFRYHPNLQNWMTKSTHPALVVLARDKDDKVCGIQAIFLDPKTAQKAALNHNAKLSRGFIGEGACVHEAVNRSTQPLTVAIAEGSETALSVAEAHPDWDVYVSFGVSNFEKTALKTQARSVIICADNDGRDSGTEKAVHAASQKLVAQGVEVFVAEPSPIEGQKKVDFNDVLKAKGVQQVRLDLDLRKIVCRAEGNLKIKPRQQATEKIVDPRVIKSDPESLESLLKRYVEMELETTRLVNRVHVMRAKEEAGAADASIKMLAHVEALSDFSASAMKHAKISEIIAFLEKQPKRYNAPTLASLGGFKGIYERIEKQSLTQAEIHILAGQLKGRAESRTRTLQQKQDRHRGGGRSR